MIGFEQGPSFPMEGSLPPDLQGTLFRVGPRRRMEGDDGNGAQPEGVLHAVELRDGAAVSFLRRESPADAGVFWHAGSVLALPETGLPSQYSRFLEPEEFGGGLTVPIASHVHRVAADGARVLFAVDEEAASGGEGASEGVRLRIGEWEATGALRTVQSVELERATWQHDVGVTARHVAFIESPTTRVPNLAGNAVPFGWLPGTEGWLGLVERGGDGTGVRWIRLDPCLVTHVLGAWEEEGGAGGADDDGAIVLYVCRYAAPEVGQPIDVSASVVGPAGVGLSAIGGSLAVLERWRIAGERLERTQVDDRCVEYPRRDAACEGVAFRYGYCIEMRWGDPGGLGGSGGSEAHGRPAGLLQFDLIRQEATAWNPGPGREVGEPIFVRAVDGRSDDEGWLLAVVNDANATGSDLYVLDASSMARRGPEAVIHLPERLPLRSHGEWVSADRYR